MKNGNLKWDPKNIGVPYFDGYDVEYAQYDKLWHLNPDKTFFGKCDYVGFATQLYYEDLLAKYADMHLEEIELEKREVK